MLTSAQSIQGLATIAADYDRDPFLLTVGNGTLNFRTGKLQPFNPDDLITRATEIPYYPEAICSRWERFLEEVFTGDVRLSSFVQRAVGYSMTGDTREQCLFILYGNGANGKSTFLELILRLVGTYGAITSFSTFLVHQNPGTPRNDVAKLHGARLVKAAESQKQAALDEATINEVTGQDTISARFLFKEFFEYRPQFKIWLATNHRPTIHGTDDAIWRRIKIIPFEQQFTGKQRDARLRDKLEGELSGILAWAVRGCLEWQRIGLGNAPVVEKATLSYRRESDHFGRFLNEHCINGPRQQASGSELFDTYVQWCAGANERPESNNIFAKALVDRGINRDLSRLRRMFSLAVEWELLEESPMKGMKFLRENNAHTRYLSLEESQRLIASCIAPHIRAIVTVALHSGMRLGEILNLRWHDLDFASGFILVRDSKNGESRHVPMDATLSALFHSYPRKLGTDLVFSSPSGGRIVDVRTGFQNACKRAGLPDLHFHDLRHTFASQFVMSGGDLYILKEILGHKSITMTQRYAHLSPTYKIKAIDRMNTLWAGAAPQTSASGMLSGTSSVTAASQPRYENIPTPA